MQHLLDLARPFWPLILALVVWPIVGAALSWWLWWDTPAHWDTYAAAHPGRALAIRALRTVSPHLRKLVVAWREYAAARSSLPLSALAEKQGALDVSATRPSVAPSTPTPADGVDPADEDAHASIVPPPPFDPHRTMRGSVDVRSLLAVVVALSVVLPLGAALYGCPRLPPVAGCQPTAQTCIGDRPHVCSASQRWEPAGDVSCATTGGACAVAGGVAYCAPSSDGGVR